MIPESVIDYENKHPIEPAPWELPGHDCPACQEPMNESERVCSICRAEAAALAVNVVMPALAIACGRVAQRRTVKATIAAAVEDVFERLAVEADGYALVSKIGSLAMLGWSLGSLAALSRML